MKNKYLQRLELKIYLEITVVYVVLGVATWLLLEAFVPEGFTALYPSVDLFYWICGMALNYFLFRNRLKGGNSLLNTFLMVRTIKFVCVIALLMVGLMVFQAHKMAFTINLLVNYFVYSAFELYIYYRYNKRYGDAPKK